VLTHAQDSSSKHVLQETAISSKRRKPVLAGNFAGKWSACINDSHRDKLWAACCDFLGDWCDISRLSRILKARLHLTTFAAV